MHRSIVLAAVGMLAGCTAPAEGVDAQWELVWADEFEGDALKHVSGDLIPAAFGGPSTGAEENPS